MMSSKTYLLWLTLLITSVVGAFVLVNVYVDIYGLFRGRADRKVYVNERTSKYLLSFKYIPDNYDGFIVGPSLSDNLNPAEITSYEVYNASIMGANISDLHHLITNIVDNGRMKIAIICLDPYLTKDFGPKAATIHPKEYYGALGSTNLLKTYLMYFVREHKLMPDHYAPDLVSKDGWNRFELEMEQLNVDSVIAHRAKAKIHEKTLIDERAYNELNQVLQELRAKNIRIVAFFNPVPHPIYQVGKDAYHQYEEKMKKLFTADDILLNLNDEKFIQYTSNLDSYIDHAHLSAVGQAFVLEQLDLHLPKHGGRQVELTGGF